MNNSLSRFSGLVKKDAALEKAAAQEIDDLFGSAPPSRYEAAHLTRCLDGSGSIWDLVEETKSAFRELDKEFPDVSHIDLMFFDRVVRLNSLAEFRADGNTAMRDSILAGIEVTKAEVNHDNVLFVLTSDGMDNASKASVKKVREAVEEMKARGWQFYAIFLTKKARLGWRQSSACLAFEQLGIKSIQEQDIGKAVQKLADGIYGYLETGKLYLPETT